jgi:HPt (histidine-containing phosphotransfer) domain-containing protein
LPGASRGGSLMEDLYAKFLPQFVALARSRVAVAISVATKRDHAETTTIVRELHTLAGEAGLLGLSDVVPLARECELKAKQLHVNRGDTDAEVLVAALRKLERIIESIGATSPS